MIVVTSRLSNAMKSCIIAMCVQEVQPWWPSSSCKQQPYGNKSISNGTNSDNNNDNHSERSNDNHIRGKANDSTKNDHKHAESNIAIGKGELHESSDNNNVDMTAAKGVMVMTMTWI